MATKDEEVKLTQADLDSIKTQEATDLKASNTMYDDMYQDVKDTHTDTTNAIKANQATQNRIANESYEFAIDQIEQQKAQTRKDYVKEQSGAYVDWQKQSNPYGANAEKMASQGLTNSGYSESSQVSMYNTYQNRVMAARESYQLALQNYNNAMTEAKLQNSSLLAQIAAETLEKQLEADLTFLQMGQSILTQKADAAYKIKQTAQSNWMDVYKAIEARREYDESHDLAERQFKWQQEQAETKYGGEVKGGNTKADTKTNSRGYRTSRVQKNTQTEEDMKPTAKSKAYAEVKKIINYDQALSVLASCGISPSETGMSLLKSGEWNRAKRRGELGSDIEDISSYQEYLQYYCTWAIKNFA